MELYISIGALLIAILTFLFGRRDKIVQETKEGNLAVINYQLKELSEDIKTLSDKFDKYVDETDDRIDKAIKLHEKIYHKGGN